MNEELIRLIKEQDSKLNDLLQLLENQRSMIRKKDAIGLECLVDEINDCSKKIAEIELQRRNLIGKISLTQYIEKQGDKILEEAYKEIRNTLDKVKERKESNEMLLKQELSFTARILAILNPDRNIKTYNSYGGLRR